MSHLPRPAAGGAGRRRYSAPRMICRTQEETLGADAKIPCSGGTPFREEKRVFESGRSSGNAIDPGQPKWAGAEEGAARRTPSEKAVKRIRPQGSGMRRRGVMQSRPPSQPRSAGVAQHPRGQGVPGPVTGVGGGPACSSTGCRSDSSAAMRSRQALAALRGRGHGVYHRTLTRVG
jgi:hypothetical protein